MNVYMYTSFFTRHRSGYGNDKKKKNISAAAVLWALNNVFCMLSINVLNQDVVLIEKKFAKSIKYAVWSLNCNCEPLIDLKIFAAHECRFGEIYMFTVLRPDPMR